MSLRILNLTLGDIAWAPKHIEPCLWRCGILPLATLQSMQWVRVALLTNLPPSRPLHRQQYQSCIPCCPICSDAEGDPDRGIRPHFQAVSHFSAYVKGEDGEVHPDQPRKG